MNRILVSFLATFILTGCNLISRLSTVGDPPNITQIQDPTQMPGYSPVVMPMPEGAVHQNPKANSLWENGARAFFKDQRASKVGDILTVKVSIQSEGGSFKVSGDQQITHTSDYKLNTFLGLEQRLKDKLLPRATQLPLLMNAVSDPSRAGSAEEKREDSLTFTIACTVIQVLPNGNLVISGRQEARFVNELRDITMTGVVRREDITPGNTITSDKIAEARLSYGGRGDLSDQIKTPYLNQAVRRISPF